MSGREIGYSPKRRNSGLRKPKKIILIVAEGNNQTETNYFRHFTSHDYRIQFAHGNDTDPVKMINTVKSQFEMLGLDAENGDLGISLIDTDCEDYKNAQIKAADKLCNKAIRQCVSSPCFEIWLLCHFNCSTRQYNSSEEVIKHLQKHIKDYTKNDEEIFDKTKININTAIENAKNLKTYCLSSGKKPHTVGFMPSTEIVDVVEILQGLQCDIS